MWRYKHKRDPLTADETNRLVNSCCTPKEKLVVYTLLDTGLRVEEFCSLVPNSIDWQGRKIIIYGKNTSLKGGAKKRRVVPMPHRAKAILEHHFALQNDIGMTTRTAERICKLVANRAAIAKPCSPHVLRHTFAVESLNNGVPITALQQVLGHEDLQTTMIYLNLSNEEAVRMYQVKGY